jgi:RNA polymerase sigma-70 factor (ECF subfamily)
VAAVFDSNPAQNATAETLGDVLYAGKATAGPSEKDWVELVRAVAAADQVALHRLYERSHRVVFTLAMRITGNRATAEEVTLDVFHDVWRRAGAYDPANGTVLGWIMNQARSRAIDRVRREQRKKRTAPQCPEVLLLAHSTDMLEVKQEGQALQAALAVLTPQEREAIEAAFFSELTHAEVATKLDQPLGTVKTRIRSGLQKLRQALAPKES